jgi:hypothetical protein
VHSLSCSSSSLANVPPARSWHLPTRATP